MRRLTIGLAIAIGLTAPATASAITASEARELVSKKLTRVYGVAWRKHAPAWSRPECRAPNLPQQWVCPTQFEHGGVWHRVEATVIGGRVKFWRLPRGHWTRRWTVSKPSCTTQGTGTVVGRLSSNDGRCYALTLWQNFGDSDGDGKVRYTGFKPSVMVYGTGTGVWPDFYLFKCMRSSSTYQCTNRFGDGFRWEPSATPGPPSPTTEFYANVAGGRIGCGLGPMSQMICMGIPAGTEPLVQVAMVFPSGSVTSCQQSLDDPSCFSGDLGERVPTIASGQEVTIGPYRCAVSDTGVQCTVAASGKGFMITLQQITGVGGATVTPG
jgi:hypothetical protein